MEQGNNRKLGVVYTPEAISSRLTKIALNASRSVEEIHVLEPSAGDGSFLKAIDDLSDRKHLVTAIDIDGDIVETLSKVFKNKFSKNSEFVKGDFIDFVLNAPEKRYHLIVGNPPFIRKHSFSDEFKSSIERLSVSTMFEKKHLKNAWAAFVVAAETVLTIDGVLAFIVPYELVNVDYGVIIQSEIFSKFDRVDIYLPSKRAFKTIEQDAVAFVASKQSSRPNGIYAHGVESLETIGDEKAKLRSTSNLADSKYLALDSKSFLLTGDAVSLISRLKSAIPEISSFCNTAPGIVTGANDFFILKSDQIEKLGLKDWCRPIVKKGSYLPHTPIFSKRALSKLQIEYPSCLLCIDDIAQKQLPKELQIYLSSEEALVYSQRYKCRTRKHWYSVPIVEAKPVFFFKRSYLYPRVVVNHANALTTDTAYGIAPKENISAKGICYSFYNSLTLLFSEIEGRFYGGGVLELTPKEFRSLPLSYVEPTAAEFSQFTALHKAGGDLAKLAAQFGDEWLSQKLSLSQSDMALLENSWTQLRKHRLRHGSHA